MYNMYGAGICKDLVNWGNYTERVLNLKWPNWGSFDIPKLVSLCPRLEKASHTTLLGIYKCLRKETIE